MVKNTFTLGVVVSMVCLALVPSARTQLLDNVKNAFDKANTFLSENVGKLVNSVKCIGDTSQDENLKKCQEEAQNNWKAEDPKKQTCCRTLAIKDCILNVAKEKCSEDQYKEADKQLISGIDGQCHTFVEDPSTCGTMTLVPTISFIVISIAVALKLW